MKANEPARSSPPRQPHAPATNPRNPKKKQGCFAGVLGACRESGPRAARHVDAGRQAAPASLTPEQPPAPRPRPDRVPGPEEEPRREPPRPDPVDPWSRVLAHPLSAPARPSAPPPPPSLPVEVALEQLVRRFSWGGNGRRGTARVEVGAGALAGATVVVQVEGGEVSVEIETPNGVDHDQWRARLVSRLEQRGLVVSP